VYRISVGSVAEFTRFAVGDPPEVWADLGFTVDDGCVAVSGVRLCLGAATPGLSSWALRQGDGEEPPPTPAHPNGVRAIDHVVLLTPHLERTVDDLAGERFDLRRIRDAGNGLRQAFFRLGPVILEVVGDTDDPAPRLWGLTFVVEDLDATAAFLGARLRPPKDAVQPGRRIATLDRSAGSTVPLAFMSPPPGSGRRIAPHTAGSSSQNRLETTP
jgi:hypothetical protein